MTGMSTVNNQLVGQTELRRFFDDIATRMGLIGDTNLSRRSSHLMREQQELEEFFTVVTHRVTLAEARQRRLDKRLATGFNVFDLIDPDENKLSDILAILFDPNGGHGQGDLFLRLLFEKLGLGSDPKLTKCARVQREAPTYGIQKHRRRIDVLVEAGVLLAIENKVDSSEQADQVKDYLEHLRRCMEVHRRNSVLIYLSPDGRPPESLSMEMLDRQRADGRLYCWSYRKELREWLEDCQRECQAEKMCAFLSDFIIYIENHLECEPVTSTEEEESNER